MARARQVGRCRADPDLVRKEINGGAFYDSSTFASWVGPDESKDPIAIDARERGEYSAESLLPDEEYGEGGRCSCWEPC